MRVRFSPSAFRQTSWFEYTIRFFFGGLITVAAGAIAKEYGPGIGGLFLAFPAIFPAAATLIEKNQKQKKQRRGLHGMKRASEAVSLEAAGAARGCVALLGFAAVASWLMPAHKAGVVLSCATLAWVALAGLAWEARHVSHWLRRRRRTPIG